MDEELKNLTKEWSKIQLEVLNKKQELLQKTKEKNHALIFGILLGVLSSYLVSALFYFTGFSEEWLWCVHIILTVGSIVVVVFLGVKLYLENKKISDNIKFFEEGKSSNEQALSKTAEYLSSNLGDEKTKETIEILIKSHQEDLNSFNLRK